MGRCKIIIVGESNLCRSFMAEAILRGKLQRKGVSSGVEVISRGLVVLFSEPVSPIAAKLLTKRGYNIEEFRSSQLSAEDMEDADLVLTLTREQAEEVRIRFGTQAACMWLGDFIDMEEPIPKVGEETEEAYQEGVLVLEQLMEAAADRVIGELLIPE